MIEVTTFYVNNHEFKTDRPKSYPVLEICDKASVNPNNAIVTLRRSDDVDIDPYSIIDINEDDDFLVMHKSIT